eukprot:TRINITY_DN12728_c0_g1_i1.p1 TRINITY_DN12728_c0_g1~~TRINITY_DN12728_c0_g1_i1.p1  ORF type:complete len:437 (+),score=48.27 TRINITY_DN12728_c0_g1_i1:147-1457(+)
MIELSKVILGTRPDDVKHQVLTIQPFAELLSEDILRQLEQTPGLTDHIQRFQAYASFCIPCNSQTRSRKSRAFKPQHHAMFAKALLHLLIRQRVLGKELFDPSRNVTILIQADNMSTALMALLFEDAVSMAIRIESALPSPQLTAGIAAKPADASIDCGLSGEFPTPLRASILRSKEVELSCCDDTPLLEFATNTIPFFDAPYHTIQRLSVSGLASRSECRLPIIHVRRLRVRYGGICLSPGSTIHRCELDLGGPFDVGGVDLSGIKCYSIIIFNTGGWKFLHVYSQTTKCTKLKLVAADWQEMMALPDHPMLNDVQLLEINPHFYDQEIPDNHVTQLDEFLARFPRLKYAYYCRSAFHQNPAVPVKQLLAYKTLHQQQLHLADYKTLLPDSVLQKPLLGLYAAHLALLLADCAISVAVSQRLLRAVLLVDRGESI